MKFLKFKTLAEYRAYWEEKKSYGQACGFAIGLNTIFLLGAWYAYAHKNSDLFWFFIHADIANIIAIFIIKKVVTGSFILKTLKRLFLDDDGSKPKKPEYVQTDTFPWRKLK